MNTRQRQAPPSLRSVRVAYGRVFAPVWDYLAVAAAAVIRWFPFRFRARLRERLSRQHLLDYPDVPIRVVVTSIAEYSDRLRPARKEPETVDWIRRTLQAGAVFCDVGANIGGYALFAARWTRGAATVYAIEPSPSTFARLVENIRLNALETTVIPFPVAAGRVTEMAGFRYASDQPGSARHPGLGDPLTTAGDHAPVLVPVFRLDDLVRIFALRAPSHLKIDVDGYELDVLLGAEQMLRSDRLRGVLVEVDVSRGTAAEVRSLLTSHGFTVEHERRHDDTTICNWIFQRPVKPS